MYSDDRPIEFWRTIVGFYELKPRPITFHTIDPFTVEECQRYKDEDREVAFGEGNEIFGREVVGKVTQIKFEPSMQYTDITIIEMVPTA